MAEITKEEVAFMKEAKELIKVLLACVDSSKSFEIRIEFDEKNALPLIIIKKNNT